MEETNPVKTGVGESLSAEQVTSIAGGDGSTATVTASATPSVVVTAGGADPGAALIAIYEGFVDVTSHIIERVVNAAK